MHWDECQLFACTPRKYPPMHAHGSGQASYLFQKVSPFNFGILGSRAAAAAAAPAACSSGSSSSPQTGAQTMIGREHQHGPSVSSGGGIDVTFVDFSLLHEGRLPFSALHHVRRARKEEKRFFPLDQVGKISFSLSLSLLMQCPA